MSNRFFNLLAETTTLTASVWEQCIEKGWVKAEEPKEETPTLDALIRAQEEEMRHYATTEISTTEDPRVEGLMALIRTSGNKKFRYFGEYLYYVRNNAKKLDIRIERFEEWVMEDKEKARSIGCPPSLTWEETNTIRSLYYRLIDYRSTEAPSNAGCYYTTSGNDPSMFPIDTLADKGGLITKTVANVDEDGNVLGHYYEVTGEEPAIGTYLPFRDHCYEEEWEPTNLWNAGDLFREGFYLRDLKTRRESRLYYLKLKYASCRTYKELLDLHKRICKRYLTMCHACAKGYKYKDGDIMVTRYYDWAKDLYLSKEQFAELKDLYKELKEKLVVKRSGASCDAWDDVPMPTE